MKREYSAYGAIYKIYNDVNQKVYIGQTIRTLDYRLKRHLKEATKNAYPKNKFHRAIRKHGVDKFHIELVDEAATQEELNTKEKEWIHICNSIENGYNTAAGGEGGNTYKGRSKAQMKITSHKLSIANIGAKNGMSHQIKAKNIQTGEEFHFETLGKCLQFLGIKNKGVVMSRANGKVKTYWRDNWMFAYENLDYGEYSLKEPYDSAKRNGKLVILQSQTQILKFNSISAAERFLKENIRNKDGMIIKSYLVTIQGPSRLNN